MGLHKVRVRLHPEVTVDVTANVARSTEEAEAQARGERPSAIEDEVEVPEDELSAEEVFEESPEQPTDEDKQPTQSDDEDRSNL